MAEDSFLFTASSKASGVLRAYVPVTLWMLWPNKSEMSYSCTCLPVEEAADHDSKVEEYIQNCRKLPEFDQTTPILFH